MCTHSVRHLSIVDRVPARCFSAELVRENLAPNFSGRNSADRTVSLCCNRAHQLTHLARDPVPVLFVSFPTDCHGDKSWRLLPISLLAASLPSVVRVVHFVAAHSSTNAFAARSTEAHSVGQSGTSRLCEATCDVVLFRYAARLPKRQLHLIWDEVVRLTSVSTDADLKPASSQGVTVPLVKYIDRSAHRKKVTAPNSQDAGTLIQCMFERFIGMQLLPARCSPIPQFTFTCFPSFADIFAAAMHAIRQGPAYRDTVDSLCGTSDTASSISDASVPLLLRTVCRRVLPRYLSHSVSVAVQNSASGERPEIEHENQRERMGWDVQRISNRSTKVQCIARITNEAESCELRRREVGRAPSSWDGISSDLFEKQVGGCSVILRGGDAVASEVRDLLRQLADYTYHTLVDQDEHRNNSARSWDLKAAIAVFAKIYKDTFENPFASEDECSIYPRSEIRGDYTSMNLRDDATATLYDLCAHGRPLKRGIATDVEEIRKNDSFCFKGTSPHATRIYYDRCFAPMRIKYPPEVHLEDSLRSPWTTFEEEPDLAQLHRPTVKKRKGTTGAPSRCRIPPFLPGFTVTSGSEAIKLDGIATRRRGSRTQMTLNSSGEWERWICVEKLFEDEDSAVRFIIGFCFRESQTRRCEDRSVRYFTCYLHSRCKAQMRIVRIPRHTEVRIEFNDVEHNEH